MVRITKKVVKMNTGPKNEEYRTFVENVLPDLDKQNLLMYSENADFKEIIKPEITAKMTEPFGINEHRICNGKRA